MTLVKQNPRADSVLNKIYIYGHSHFKKKSRTLTKDKTTWSNQSQGHVKKWSTVVVSLMLVACLSRDNSALEFCLCRPTMTLHHGQGHRDEHELICHAQVYRHAKIECHSLNTVRDMASLVQVKHLSRLKRSCDLE